MAARAGLREGWKRSRLLRSSGIPAPSGQFSVGCVDLMHKFEDEPHSLLVRLFYPCQEGDGGGRFQYAQWLPHKRYVRGYVSFTEPLFPGLAFTFLTDTTEPKIPALYGAPLFRASKTVASGRESQFPVIVFCHGLGGMRTANSGVCCDLASHGYIVGSIEHRDGSACASMRRVPKPGGREGELQDDWLEFYHLQDGENEFPVRLKQVKQRAVDAKKALDLLELLNDGVDVGNLLGADFDFHQFHGRMDMSTAAIMGHSFGGATTVQTLSEDQRFKCGIGLDTWMGPIHRDLYKNGSVIKQPLILINSYTFQWKDNIKKMMALTKPPDNRGRSTCRIVTLKYTTHVNQCDMMFVFPEYFIASKTMSKLEPVIAHEVNMDICHSFLKRHLLKDPAYQGPSPNLDGCEGHSEHILFGSNVDITEGQSSIDLGLGQSKL